MRVGWIARSKYFFQAGGLDFYYFSHERKEDLWEKMTFFMHFLSRDDDNPRRVN